MAINFNIRINSARAAQSSSANEQKDQAQAKPTRSGVRSDVSKTKQITKFTQEGATAIVNKLAKLESLAESADGKLGRTAELTTEIRDVYLEIKRIKSETFNDQEVFEGRTTTVSDSQNNINKTINTVDLSSVTGGLALDFESDDGIDNTIEALSERYASGRNLYDQITGSYIKSIQLEQDFKEDRPLDILGQNSSSEEKVLAKNVGEAIVYASNISPKSLTASSNNLVENINKQEENKSSGAANAKTLSEVV